MPSQKSKFPSYGLVRGPSHERGGVAGMVADEQPVELEGGEWIVPKEAVPDYLPALIQMTNTGRMRQAMQNGNSAMDALIASASMQNGISEPKSPMYQEGGEVSFEQIADLAKRYRDNIGLPVEEGMFTPEGGFTKEGYARKFGVEPESFDIDTVFFKSPANYSFRFVDKKGEPIKSTTTKGQSRTTMLPILSDMLKQKAAEKIDVTDFDNIQKRMKQAQMENTFSELVRQATLEYPKAKQKQQGGMIEYEDGGEVHSRRMYNQGTGFDKKKSDLDGDGNISEYERKRGMAIAKSMGKMQEGGMVADKTRVSQTYYPTESLNLPMANLASPMNVGSVSQAPMSNQDIAQIVMDIATPGSVIGSIGKKAAKVNPFSMKAKASKIANRRDASGRLYRDPIGGLSKKGMLKLVDEAVPENTMDAYGESLDYFKDMDADDLADVVRGAYGLARNPKFYGEERIGQGAFDLGREGVKMALDDIKNLNIKQQGGPINNYQMGGMVNRQPMMQRPMNPAMNFSPMQRMNPRMYQEGGQVQPRKQFELRNPETFIGPPDSLIGRVYMNPFTGEFEDADAQDKRIEEQIKRLRQRMKQSEIPSSKERVPMQEGGQVQLRRQAEKNTMSRQPKEKMDVIFPFLESIPRYLYPDFMGPRSPKQMLEVEDLFDEILRNAKGDRKYYIPDSDKEETGMKMAQEGGMVSNNNLMGSIASDQRVAPLQPDVYQSKSENGVTIEQRVEVPKLAEAILPIYGLETPLSKNQGSMLKRNNVTPNVLNPQVKGLINRVLVQRLAAEGS